ncbi:MAG: tryptophan 7-halogenase [Geodermatophilaceae bacterium]|nr:tryptophan 7-halogenase [Geodermatophilaceae bacterium]
MSELLVLGAGLGGLSTALLLARDGHRVTVVERDGDPPPADPELAWSRWDRHGVNQFRMPHYMLPRWRQLMQRELPDVLADLVAGGAAAINPLDLANPKHTGGRWDGDERFHTVTARRPVLESALARAAQNEPGVTVRRGTAIRAVSTGTPTRPGVPHVTGLVTETGEEIRADLVIDASGRRSTVPALLAAAGARPGTEQREDCGFVYQTRHFRARSGGGTPQVVAAFIQDYPGLTILTLPADNDTWAVAFVISARDRELLGLREPRAWDAAMATFPLAAHWMDGDPISGVDVIAGIEDRIRRYVVDAGPTMTGLLPVADAWACTNPSLGRGSSIGLLHACALRDLLRDNASDQPGELAMSWDERTRAEVQPWYRLTLDYDRHRLAEVDAHREGRVYRTDDPAWARTKTLANAAGRHPEVLRGVLDISALLATPQEVIDRTGIAELLDPAAESRQLPGPDRTQLLAAVAV